MTDYTKTTNFAAKDALPSGNANKIVKGTEINTEFDNLATAVATKANIANPAFTGVVSFPDGSASNPSITNTGDTNAGLFFSAADTLAFSAGGTAQVTFADGVIAPVTDSDVDLGTNSLRFKDAYVDSVTVTGNAAVTGNIDVDGTIEFDGLSGTGSVTVTDILDQDDMSGNSATALATQQSIKAYVDTQITAEDLDITTDSGTIAIDLDSETLTVSGGTGLNSSATGNAVTLAIDSTVTTLTGSQTLTNKSLTAPTLTGTATVASLDISGDIDVDGTTNLDVVDIDGAVDMASTLAVGGVVTANAGVVVDNFTLDGTTLALSSGDMTLDAAGDIILDADGADVRFADGGTQYGFVASDSSSLVIKSLVSDKDIIFRGNDNGSAITALTLDMSAAGAATFNDDISIGVGKKLLMGGGTHTYISEDIDDRVRHFVGGSELLRLTESSTNTVNIYASLTQDGGAVFNEDSADVDFRVESNGNANMLFVDGGNNRVGVGTAAPQQIMHLVSGGLQVSGNITAPASGQSAAYFDYASGGARVWSRGADASTRGTINFYQLENDGGNQITSLSFDTAGAATFNAGATFGSHTRVNGDFSVSAASGEDRFAILPQSAGSGTTVFSGNAGLTAYEPLVIDFETLALRTSGTSRLSIASNGAVSFASDIITSTAGTSNLRLGVNAGNSITSGGNYNVVVGDEAGTAITTGDQNVFVGYSAGDALVSASNNVAVGNLALSADTLGARSVAIGSSALTAQNFTSATSSYNTAVGFTAGTAVTTGVKNTLIGGLAGDALTDADGNVAVGAFALTADTLGSNSVAVGQGTLFAQNFTSATNAYNTAVGHTAGAAVTTGVQNTLIGGLAGDAITTGTNNASLGYVSLSATTTGISNTAIGSGALSANTTASNNTAVGTNSLLSNTTGTRNVAVGSLALDALTEANYNVGVGYGALSADTLGTGATAIGYKALITQNFTSATSAYNTAVGYTSGLSVTTGIQNTLIGGLAGHNLTDADYNVAMGYLALSDDTLGSRSVAIGRSALENQNFTSATNTYNTAIGYAAGTATTTGTRNTFVGGLAGDALTDADFNVGVGYNALSADTLGSRSVAVGISTLANQNFTSATDSYNTAVGHGAGSQVTTGTGNTFVGGLVGDGTDDGTNNTAVGYTALSANAGNTNTAIGYASLAVCTGTDNTALGEFSGYQVTSGSNNTLLGGDAGRSGSPGGAITTASNILSLGDENVATANIQVDWTVASDARDKTDFTALDLGLDFVKALAPVTYKWDKRSKYGDKTADDYDLTAQTPDGTHKEDWLDIGFKAQEVQALEEAAGYTTAAKKNLTVSTSGDGKQMGLQYSKFVPILVNAIQEQQALIELLTARIETLEG